MSDDAAHDVLTTLRQAYRAALPAKVDLLAAAVAARARAEAVDLAHRLRGTAGSYGCFEVSELAGRLEASLSAGEDWADAQALVEALRRAASA